jgi:hypothetical protein
MNSTRLACSPVPRDLDQAALELAEQLDES